MAGMNTSTPGYHPRFANAVWSSSRAAKLTVLFNSLLLLASAFSARAQAITQIKAANNTALSSGSSWVSGTIPTAGGIGEWNSTAGSAGDTITSLGGAFSLGGIQLSNNVAGAVSITDTAAGDVLTLNGATGTGVGMDLSHANQNLTLNTPLALGGSQTWKIASGKSVTLSSQYGLALGSSVWTITGGGTLNVEFLSDLLTASSSSPGAGLVVTNGSTLYLFPEYNSANTYVPEFNFLGQNTALTLAGGNISVGEAKDIGANVQIFSSLTLEPGDSSFEIAARNSSSGMSVGFFAANRDGGSMGDFGAIAQSGLDNFGSQANGYTLPGTVVPGWATYAANDWALPHGTNSFVLANATYVVDSWAAATNNTTVTISSAPAANATINSLRFNSNTVASPTLTLSGANIIASGGILLGSTFGSQVATLNGGTLTSGNLNADGTSDLIVINNSASSGSIVFNTVITDNGATSVGLTVGATAATTPSNPGAVTLNSANTFSGTTYVTRGSILLNHPLALQNSTFNTSLPGTLNFGSLTAATFGGLAGSGSLVLPANFNFTVGNNNQNTTISGAISGAGASLTKTGTGTLTLAGVNSYSGSTTISSGTLALGANGAFLGSATLNAGATLDVSSAGNYPLAAAVTGNGTINGNLTLENGGQLSAASSSGTLTLNNSLTLNGGSVVVNFNGSAQNSLITLGGNLTLADGTVVVINSSAPLANGTYKIISVPAGTISGAGSLLSVSGFAQPGQTATVVANPQELDLVVSTYVAQNLTWVGDGSGAGLWNIGGDADWLDNDTKSVFHNGDNTTFDDTSGNPTVSLSGVLSPGSVTVNSVNNSYTFTGAGSIGGSATLADNNSGTLTVLTVNSYSGGTTIAGGATVNVGNGTVAGSLGSGPVVDNSTLNYDLPAGTQTQGAISGSGTLTIAGAGTVVLNGADTLTGPTTVTSGILKQSAVNALPSAGPVVVNGTVDLGGLNGTVNTLTGNGTINNTLVGQPVLTVTGGGLFGGLIENSAGSLALNVNGNGSTLELTGTNTYTGTTTITDGILQLGSSNAVGDSVLNVASGGTLDLNGFSPTVDALIGGGVVDDVSAGGNLALIIGNESGSGTFSGTIQNSTGTISLVKNGTGTETITGNNNYSGATTVNAGTLELATGGSINTTTLAGQGYLVDGGTLNVSGSPDLNNVGNAFLETSGTVNLGGTVNTATIDGTLWEITGGTFTAASVALNRDFEYAGAAPAVGVPIPATTVEGFVVNGPTATVNLGTFTIGVATANSDSSAYLGAGTLNVGGELLLGNVVGGRWNVFQVNGGFLNADTAPGVVISPNNGANVVNSELYFSGPSTNVVQGITYGAATDTLGGEGFLFVNGGATVYVDTGGIVLANTHGYQVTNVLTSGTLGAQGSWASSLPFILNGTNFSLQPTDPYGNPNNISLSGVLAIGTNVSTLTISGLPGGSPAGTVYLSGANQYSGGTLVTNNATVNINGINALGGANYTGLTLNGGTLQYTNLGYPANGTYDLTTGKNGLTLGALGGTIDVNGNAVTYSGPLGNGGAGALTVLSTTVSNGVLNLLVPGTYTGGTIIGNNNTQRPGNGTLSVGNTTGSATGPGSVTVAYGGTLTGNGSISGAVEIQSGGTLNPGANGVGTTTVGALQLDSGSLGIVQFGTANNSLTVVTSPGGLVINDGNDTAAFDLYGTGGTAPLTTPGTYNLVQFTGTPPVLDASWTTASGANPHIANPQPNSVYAFGINNGYLTVTVTCNGTAVAAVWSSPAGGNWSAAANWSSNPNVPHAPGDTATFGDGTALSTVTLNAAETVGTLTFDNPNSYVIANAGQNLTLDNTGLGAGIFVTAGSANRINAPLVLNDNVTVALSAGQSLAVAGNVSSLPNGNLANGTEMVTVGGPGTLTLAGNNSYGPAAGSGSYGTVISGGGATVQVAGNNALSAGDVKFAGPGTLQAGAANVSLANNLDIAQGVTATINNNGNTLTLGGVISDGGNLTLVGNGTLALTNNNNGFYGFTTVNAGVLSLTGSGDLGGSQSLNLVGGDVLGAGATPFGIVQNINIGPATGATGGTGLVDAASGQQFTLTGNLATAGNTGTNNLVVNSGPGNNGTVILAGTGTYNGWTVISNGVLDVQSATALQSSTLDYNNQGGTLVFDSILGTTFGGLTGTQSLALTNIQGQPVTLSVGNNSLSNNYAGNLNDGGLGGALTKVGTGTETLSGSNVLSGIVSVSGGTLELPAGGYLYAGSYLGGGGFLVDGGTLINANFNTAFADTVAIVQTAGIVRTAGTFRSSSSDGTLFAIYGGNFSAANVTLERTFNNGTIPPTPAAPLAAVTTSGVYVDSTNTAAPALVNLGALYIGTENSSASFREDAGTVVVTNEVLVGSTSNTRWNILQVNGGTFSSLDTLNGIVLAVNNGTTSNNAELYLSGGTTYAQLIAFGSASDTVTGFGDLIINGGSLYLGSLGITNPNPNNYQYLIALNSGLLGALGNLAITNNLQLSASNFTFQAADNNGVAKAITLNGTVTGPGGLVKSGGGTLTLNNSADSWTGSTIISNGVLALVGTTGLTNSSLIDVTAPGVLNVSGRTDDTLWLGATPVSQVLSGNGTLTGRLVVANNGTLAPGAALTNTATLTVSGSATLGGATVLNLNRTNSPNSDGLVASSITAGGSLTVVNIGTPLQAGDTFTLFSPPVSGAFSVTNLPALSPGLAWTNTLASNGRLAIVATVNPNPTQLTATVSGNVLSLAWPADHIGWRLEVQTNHLAGGISANPNDWGTVLGSTAINQTNLTINPAVPTEFYRLVYP